MVTDPGRDLPRARLQPALAREGIEIVGLCGARVVAHRDYEQFPICPTCKEIHDGLRRPEDD